MSHTFYGTLALPMTLFFLHRLLMQAMRQMLRKCENFAKDFSICFNTKTTTNSTFLKSPWFRYDYRPVFRSNGTPIQYVKQWPHHV
jgi:hypothetical protein